MNPIIQTIDQLNRLTLETHSWISKASTQVKQFRREDQENGIEWESLREREAGNSLPSE